jgi:dipeptidyl aminopeptidase/acylaminoacyl peptidase
VSRITALVLCLLPVPALAQEPLQTVAERTNYRETSRHADVTAFCERLAKESPAVRLTDFGTSTEGRKLHLLVLADPPVATPEEAVKTGKPVVLAFANIHAGEVDGKEAVLALARDLVREKELLKKLVVLIIPNLNPDGNEKIDPKNRTTQNGPPAGVGLRANAQGFDLNRDFVKLESPEIRGLVRVFDKWDPVLVVDCHTTNGSYHRFVLTYDGPRYPAADPRVVEFGQEKVLPDLAARVKKATNFDCFPYGNFSRDKTRWETYPSSPRFSTQYLALRGKVGLLSESYTYAPFADRVKASYAFVRAALDFTAAHADELKKLTAEAAKPRNRVALRTKTVESDKGATVLGYEETTKDGRRVRTDTPKDYPVRLVTRVEPTLEADVPAAYLIPPGFPAAVETLQRHGVKCEELHEDVQVDAQGYVATEVNKADHEFQKHALVTLEVKPEKVKKMAPAGCVVVRTAQPLGNFAAYLLEPQSEDGLATWNFFDKGLAVGKPFPVLRLAAVPAALAGAPESPAEEQEPPRKYTLDSLLEGQRPAGRPAAGGGRPFARGGFGGSVEWLPDGEHYLQSRQGGVMKVEARSGKAEPFVDPEKLRTSLSVLKDLPERTVDQLVRVQFFRMDKDRTGTLVDVGPDYAFAYFDGSPAVRLTRSAGGNELVSLGPDGKRVAFVRGGNLFVAGPDGEKQLTTDGGGDVLNGKNDWVYFEEIFNRNYKAYWWSPDGSAIAFFRFDTKPVKRFTIADPIPNAGGVEATPYPKVGDPNPTVKIGVVSAGGGEPTFLDLSGYPPESTLISRVGWLPGSKYVFAYVQDRQQTWLDFLTWPDPRSKPVKLFRETTKAWVEDLGEPKFLKDGSFLVHSERTGWKHMYHYGADGKLIRPVTGGEWEARTIDRVDEDQGYVYFSGTKDGPTRSHFYRAKLDGSGVERVTPSGGTHAVTMAPKGPLYVDRFSDDETPQRSVLCEVGKGMMRTLEANAPDRERTRYKFGKSERMQVPMKDGFVLEGIVTYPPDFDPSKKYPVWVQTYAGPHAPTVRDGFRGGPSFEQALAGSGVVSFRVDPRSASGKGAASAWACYRQLGVQELKDLEEAVDWLCKNPWADAARVGLSGHSYGGFMTAYALTHSKKFAAGIAGAPVTDWRLYDSIYTERYMGLPSENKEGYDKSSVVKAAANLHGKLLIVHGLVDDNVHAQNTFQFVDALQRANKEFELMVYPRSRHGIAGPHYTRLQVSFIKRSMGLDPSEPRPSGSGSDSPSP